MELTGLTGTKYQLDSKPLISGGEGSIYHVTDGEDVKVAKVYHADSLSGLRIRSSLWWHRYIIEGWIVANC